VAAKLQALGRSRGIHWENENAEHRAEIQVTFVDISCGDKHCGHCIPLNYDLQNDGGTQIVAAVALFCAGIFLLFLKRLATLIANFNVNEL
jgi:hypothetical protein